MSTVAAVDLSAHAATVLRERGIDMDWVRRAIVEPDQSETRDDGSEHFLKVIPERGGRVLRVVADQVTKRIITVFFDRRMKGIE